MATNKFPTNQAFEKMEWGEKYETLEEIRKTAISRREHFRKYWKDPSNRKQINRNFAKIYNKLEREVGVYKRGYRKGELKAPTPSMTNKELNAMYAKYNMFARTDIYSREGRRIKNEQTKKAMQSLKENQAFEDLADDDIQNLYDFYNQVGRELISQYGSEETKDLFTQYQDLNSRTVMETMADVIEDSVTQADAIMKVHEKLLPKVLRNRITKWQKELDDIGYDDYSAKDIVELFVQGKAPGYERIKLTDPEDIIYYFKQFIKDNK